MTEVFSKQDAVELLAIAQEAPIPGGARMAVARQELYNRFAIFFESATAVPELQPATPVAPRKRRTKAEIKADEAAASKALDVLA